MTTDVDIFLFAVILAAVGVVIMIFGVMLMKIHDILAQRRANRQEMARTEALIAAEQGRRERKQRARDRFAAMTAERVERASASPVRPAARSTAERRPDADDDAIDPMSTTSPLSPLQVMLYNSSMSYDQTPACAPSNSETSSSSSSYDSGSSSSDSSSSSSSSCD